MNNQQLIDICNEFDYSLENGLVIDNPSNAFQEHFIKFTKNKIKADAVFFYQHKEGQEVPLIYFKTFDYVDETQFAEMHKMAWNQGQAPLLFIILPTKVIIYNLYAPPRLLGDNLDPQAGLLDEIELLPKFRDKINQYKRSEIVTDNYWKKNEDKFSKHTHVSEMLLNNLFLMRDYLQDKMSDNTIHTLLLRSIFIKYLEDRKDNHNNNVFPDYFYSGFKQNAKCFVDLLDDKHATYNFFNALHKKFNGDVFDISEQEVQEVTEVHLKELKKLLTGEVHLLSNQTVLWPLYSFDLIPIELLSEVYQYFYHSETDEDENGTHYTPLHLVSFLMDEILPWSNEKINIKILDPACGSGIFLVESYKRLINTWMKQNTTYKIDIEQLNKILKKNIFGVDLNINALRVAALSLYLTICDYLEPRDIWESLEFVELIGTNLIRSDFFDYKLFSETKFDLVVGNPPWKSDMSRLATTWIKFFGLPVGDKQICQAFLWKIARNTLKKSGKCCLLVSSKAFLFNRNPKNQQFRNKFFKDFKISKIYNYSFIRRELFTKAIGPAVAVFFENQTPSDDDIITYINIKPTFTVKDDCLFEITSSDITHFNYDLAFRNDYIWKIGMWGSVRDYELISRISSQNTLLNIVNENKWISGEGFIVKGKKQDFVPEFYGKKLIESKNMTKFLINEENITINTNKKYYRHVKTKRDIFLGPHILIKQYPKRNVYGLISALSVEDILFKDAIIGIHGKSSDLDIMSKCVLILNSKVTTYYQALTSRNWLIERPALQKEEVMNTPMPIGFDELNYDYNKLQTTDTNLLECLHSVIYDSFKISKYDVFLIEDLINYTLDYFWNRNESMAVKKLRNTKMLMEYCELLCEILNSSFNVDNMTFNGDIYYEKESPLLMVIIELNDQDKEKIKIHHNLDILTNLDKQLIEEKTRSIYLEKELILFRKEQIIIIKHNKNKNWIKSMALKDADYIYTKIMNLKEVI